MSFGDQQTIEEFVKAFGITISAEKWHENPHMQDSSEMDHWRCTLRCEMHIAEGYDKPISVFYSKGRGHKGARPTAEEVLDCLASEAAHIDSTTTFEDWCREHDYDNDSRKAERIFRASRENGWNLHTLLSDGLMEQLLYRVERE